MDYNRRLQASEVKLKQSSTGSELQRYNYSYGQVTQSSGSVDTSKNNGQIGRIDGFINGAATKEWDQRFVYDELGRLSTAAEYRQGTGSTPTWQTQYTFDRYGNRFQSGSGNSGIGYTSVTGSDIDASTNRFITSGSTPTTYDVAGNITTDTKFRGMNYSYDANGRITFSYRTDGTGGASSVYDCAGQRVQTSANNVTRTMVYDVFGQLVGDYLGSSGSTLERENIYRGGQLLAVYETGASCYKSISDFVDAFYLGALGRAYNSASDPAWKTILTQAQAQGQGQLIAAAQNLGNSVFGSSEFSNHLPDTPANRGPFVTALYAAYLGRVPDGYGYDAWVAALATSSRDEVRHGFAYSAEFQNDVGQLCVTTSSSSPSTKYVLSDLQGTTRAVMNNNGSGSSTIVARHDYLPFGEEIWAGTGTRTSSQGYGKTDAIRQKYGLTERDDATGLDHTWWRKYESFSGRMTSPDPYAGGMAVANPQSFNRYSYTQNDPVNFIDPTGLLTICFWNFRDVSNGDGPPRYVLVSVDCITIDGGFGLLGGGGGGGGGGAPLSSKNQGKYNKAKNKLVNKALKKPSQKCAELLALTGKSLNEITAAINNQVPYSGPDTKGLSLLDAGLLPAPDSNLSPDFLRLARFEVNQSVSKYFDAHRDIAAATANFRSDTINNVFFRSSGITDTGILHEALHSATGLADIPLAARLGLGTFTSSTSAGAAISAALRKAGCTND